MVNLHKLHRALAMQPHRNCLTRTDETCSQRLAIERRSQHHSLMHRWEGRLQLGISQSALNQLPLQRSQLVRKHRHETILGMPTHLLALSAKKTLAPSFGASEQLQPWVHPRD